MVLLPLLLLLLLALLGGVPLTTASMTTSVWHRAQVSQDQLAAANMSDSYQVLDEMLCAILATNNPWCHLFTFEGNTCVLYDVVVDSLADPPPGGTATPCKTRHRNVCIVEGKPLAHRDTLELDCLNTTCWNRAFVPTNAVSSKCDAPFSLVDMGCVHLYKQNKTWCEARRYCSSLEADLVVVPSESFSKLQQFLIANAYGQGVWVGVKAMEWLDGRNVTEAEWHPWEPDGTLDENAYMWFDENAGHHRLADHYCTETFWVLCMRA